MANLGYDFVLVPAGTVTTATGVGTAYELDNKNEWRGQVAVTAVTGTTPSLTLVVQTSHDGGVTDAWRTVATFPAVTTVSVTPWQGANNLDRWVRASWTVSGTTPSFTWGAAGEAV